MSTPLLGAFHRTLECCRKVRITIPKLSPTHTKVRIVQWCIAVDQQLSLTAEMEIKNGGKETKEQQPKGGVGKGKAWVESYDPIFVVEASPDMITQGYRISDDHKPLMIVEAHDEGVVHIHDEFLSKTASDDKSHQPQWYDVGTEIGYIDDEDDDEDEIENAMDDWLWQAYSHE